MQIIRIFRLFVGLRVRNYTLNVYLQSVRPLDQLQKQLAHARPGVVGFEQMLKLSINLLILLKFPLTCRNNLQRCIFLKEINH